MKRTQRLKQIRHITPMMHAGSDALNFSITMIRMRKHVRASVPGYKWPSGAKSRATRAMGSLKHINRGDWRRMVWRGRRFVKC